MFDFQYELEQLQEGNRSVELIESLINKHRERADVMRELYDRYKVKHVPIFTRELDDPMKVNNIINNDFVSEIVDTKVGYFAGTPVSYIFETNGEKIQHFIERNRLSDLDAEITKYAALCGYGARLQYVDKKGESRIVNVQPWEAILLGEDGVDETEFGIRYYEVAAAEGKKEQRVELYEPFKLTEYRTGSTGKLEEHEVTEHTYEICPMWGYENNEELLSDVEKVLHLIDAYDRAMSDVNSEIEAHRSAILAFYGVQPPQEGEDISFGQVGTLYFQEGQKGEFIVKNIQDGAVENHLNRIHENIYRFAHSPDLSDEAFGGVVSGVASKYKLLGLENKVSTWERKFKSSSVRMFEILGTSLSYISLGIDPYKIEMKFTRNFPQDLLDAAKIQTELKGNVSTRTRLALFPGILNVEGEMTDLEAEEDAYMEKMMEQETALGGESNDGQGTTKTGNGKVSS